MQESEFHQLADDIYFRLEELIDDSGVDLDYESSGGVMTITCENEGSKIIPSCQPVNAEIRVAARSGGFRLQDDQGVCATGEEPGQLLFRVIEEQSGEKIDVSF